MWPNRPREMLVGGPLRKLGSLEGETDSLSTVLAFREAEMSGLRVSQDQSPWDDVRANAEPRPWMALTTVLWTP